MCRRKELTEVEKKYLGMEKDKGYLLSTIDQLPFSQLTKNTVYHYAMDAAKQSRFSKYVYYTLNFAVIVLPVLSSIIKLACKDASGNPDWATVIINGIITLCASALALFRYHDKWTRYRTYLEKIINLMFRYMSPTLSAPEPEEQPAAEEPEAPEEDAEEVSEEAAGEEPKETETAEPAPEDEQKREDQVREAEFIREFRQINCWHQSKWAKERQNDEKK